MSGHKISSNVPPDQMFESRLPVP